MITIKTCLANFWQDIFITIQINAYLKLFISHIDDQLCVFSLRLRASYPLWKRFPSLFSWNSLALSPVLNPVQP